MLIQTDGEASGMMLKYNILKLLLSLISAPDEESKENGIIKGNTGSKEKEIKLIKARTTNMEVVKSAVHINHASVAKEGQEVMGEGTSHPSIQKYGLEIPYLCLPGQTVPAECELFPQSVR